MVDDLRCKKLFDVVVIIIVVAMKGDDRNRRRITVIHDFFTRARRSFVRKNEKIQIDAGVIGG